ncbi:hypothetical protein CH272_02645 [Rhodococcus sp. 05-340-1]|nr:hypothetical protein CH271_07940 [Rhodococcus sp. 05-340-2]OZD83320.1 hypothetical protein CH272_02645 [Rhodococcus sp. 05-340-1]
MMAQANPPANTAPEDDIEKDPTLDEGYRAGDSPSDIDWPLSIWLVRVPNPSRAQLETVQALRAEIDERGLGPVTEVVGELKNPQGEQRITVLKACDVKTLYRTVHRRRTIVLATGGVRVQNDPSERPTRKDSQPLEHYVSQKASFQLVTKAAEAARSIDNGLAWWLKPPVLRSWADEPRLLPAVCFAGLDRFGCLRDREISDFKAAHARPWTDIQGKEWGIAKAMHTRDLLHVAGTTLPLGFHWDVQLKAGKKTLANGWERWEGVTNYVNIHPNAFIRPSTGTKVYDCNRAGAVERQPRTPSHRRKGRRGRR